MAQAIAKWHDDPSWTELAESSRVTYLRALRFLAIDGKLIADVTQDELYQSRNRIMTKVGHGAANSFVSACQALFRHAKDRKWVHETPAYDLRRGLKKKSLPTWTLQDYELAKRHVPERLRRAIVLAFWTAQRRSDLIKMEWTHIDGDIIHVTQQKTKMYVACPLPPELMTELTAWRPSVVPLNGKLTGTILVTDSGKQWEGNNLSVQLMLALKKIPGLSRYDLNIHGLRKLAMTDGADSGATANQLQGMSGHKTLGEVQRYTERADRLKGARAVLEMRLLAHRNAS